MSQLEEGNPGGFDSGAAFPLLCGRFLCAKLCNKCYEIEREGTEKTPGRARIARAATAGRHIIRIGRLATASLCPVAWPRFHAAIE